MTHAKSKTSNIVVTNLYIVMFYITGKQVSLIIYVRMLLNDLNYVRLMDCGILIGLAKNFI